MTRPDYSPKDRPPVAPVVAVVVGMTLAAVAVSMWVYALAGVHL